MIATTTTKILGFMILFGPYVWEVMNDQKGDFNRRFDVWFRGLLMAMVSVINAILNEWKIIFLLQSFFMSMAIFFLLFDYTIAALLIKNKIVENPGATWFEYLSKVKEVDRWKIWANLKPRARFAIRLVCFLGALLLYLAI